MTNQTPNEQILADQLAEFTDILLDGDLTGVEGMVGEQKLQETVLLIQQTFGSAQQPDPALARRIQRAIAVEWERLGHGSKAQNTGIKLPNWLNFRIAQPAVGFALAAIIIVIFVAILAPNIDGGAVTGAAFGAWPIVLGGLLIGGVAIWLIMREK